MIQPARLYDLLKEEGIEFFTGVPDSLLRSFLAYIQDHTPASDHIITVNEGLSIGLATGYHLRTGKLPFVYLQNSGFGNIINPITSLADPDLYAIPMLIMMGWRGRPGSKDEPQHHKMGRVTEALLEALELPYYILEENILDTVKTALRQAIAEQRPVVLLTTANLFEDYKPEKRQPEYTLQRETVIRELVESAREQETFVATTGMIGRELYACNQQLNNKVPGNFLSVGAMGHANHVALGIASRQQAPVLMLDGDGALLMHLGSLTTVAAHAGDHFTHIVLNNGCHESVGGQPTTGFSTDLCQMAKAAGYRDVYLITDDRSWKEWLSTGRKKIGLQFVEVRISAESATTPGRPSGDPLAWKKELMQTFKIK